MSKSARQRAAKKLRDEAVAAEAAPPAPAPKAAGKAKAKAKAEAAPAPVPEAKAKAKGKAKAEPAAPKAEAKAKGKAAAPAPAPAAAAPKAEGKAKAKAKGKAKAKEEEAAPVKKVEPEGPPMEMDDGKGGEWEVSAGVSNKMKKQQEKKEAKAKEEEALKKAGMSGKAAHQSIPGMASAADVILANAQAKDAKSGKVGGQTHVAKAAAAIARVTEEAKVEKAKALALAGAAGPVAGAAAAPVDPNLTTASVKIDPAKVGRIIGPKGANIILIKEKTGVKTIDTAGDLCTIVGNKDEVALAEHAIRELCEKGYMSLSFDDFKEDGVMVHPSAFPGLIGERGCIIQAIKKEAKVEIDIPTVPKSGPAGKKYKVTLAGSKESVAKGIEIIESIVKHGYHEITHPGFSHAEMEVEEWKYRFLIGPGGSEMRHIQNNFKVKVNIPRETSETDKVVVLGEAADVARAVKYIEKRLFEAEQPKGRDAPEKAADDQGDDGPIEDWMKPYMYKR